MRLVLTVKSYRKAFSSMLLSILFIISGPKQLSAAEVSGKPVGPLAISADNAKNAANPSFTKIKDIRITEFNATDFNDTKGKIKELVLNAPEGWGFKSGSGIINFLRSGDIKTASLSVTAQTIRIKLIISGSAKMDELLISGIEIQAENGGDLSIDGFIYRPLKQGGDLKVACIRASGESSGCGGTAFAALSQIAGAASRLSFVSKPGASVTGELFESQPLIVTQDQFGNFSSTGLEATQMVKLKLSSGTGTLIGNINLNIGNAGGNGVINCSNLMITEPGFKKLMALANNLSFAVSNEFSVNDPEKETSISADENPDWICFLVTDLYAGPLAG